MFSFVRFQLQKKVEGLNSLEQWFSTFIVPSAPHRKSAWKSPPTYNFCLVKKYYFVLKIISVLMEYKQTILLAQNKTNANAFVE